MGSEARHGVKRDGSETGLLCGQKHRLWSRTRGFGMQSLLLTGCTALGTLLNLAVQVLWQTSWFLMSWHLKSTWTAAQETSAHM